MPLVPAKCPECGGLVEVDNEKRAGLCQHCGQPFVVEDAIQTFNTYYQTTNNYNTTHNYGEGAVVNVYEDKNKDFVIEAGVLKEYHGASTDIVIPDTVKIISPNCFLMHTEITSVKLPSSLTNLEGVGGREFFNDIELNSNNPNLIEKNDVIYSDNESKVEAFVGYRKEYTLCNSVRILSSTAKWQQELTEHIYLNNIDLKEINCNDYETIEHSKNMGINPNFKHELVENKCIHCGKYQFDSSQIEHFRYPINDNLLDDIDFSISFINNEKAAISCTSFVTFDGDIFYMNNRLDVMNNIMSKLTENGLKNKLYSVKTLILLNLNKYDRHAFNTINYYAIGLENLLTVLFPNVKHIMIEEDTRHDVGYARRECKSCLEDLVLPFIKKKMMECSLQDPVTVSYNPNLPNNFITSLNQFIESEEEKRRELKRQEELATKFRNMNKCQHCGGEFKCSLLGSIKCKNCDRPKDY